MTKTMRRYRTALRWPPRGTAGALLSVPQISLGANSVVGAIPFAADDNGTASEVQSKLNKSQFKNVKVDVQNGHRHLSGTVDLYEHKVDADKRVHKVKGSHRGPQRHLGGRPKHSRC